MLYGVIAEDTYILQSIPTLISRLVDLEGEQVVTRRMNGKPDFLFNFWRRVKEFQFKYPTMSQVVAVCDADSDCEVELANELRDRAATHLGTLPFPLLFHVIKRELETWWIAESRAISAVVGVTVPFPGGNVEEDVTDPKTYLLHRLASSRAAYTQGVAEAVARTIDLTTLRQRCPGFVRFERRIVHPSAR